MEEACHKVLVDNPLYLSEGHTCPFPGLHPAINQLSVLKKRGSQNNIMLKHLTQFYESHTINGAKDHFNLKEIK